MIDNNGENVPENLKEELNTEQAILDAINNKDMSRFYDMIKKQSITVFVAPPRLFPSLNWFEVALRAQIWVPILTPVQDTSWLNINLPGGKINDFPVRNSGHIESWDFQEALLTGRSDIGKTINLNTWKRYVLRKFTRLMSKYKNFDEAKEILSIQLSLALDSYYNSQSEDNSDEYGQTVRFTPNIANLLVSSTIRVGAGIVGNIQEWPMVLFPHNVKTEKYSLPEIPIPKNIECLENYILDPLYIHLKSENIDSINFVCDLASISMNNRYAVYKNYKSESSSIYTLTDDIFAGESILKDISDIGLEGIREVLNTRNREYWDKKDSELSFESGVYPPESLRGKIMEMKC